MKPEERIKNWKLHDSQRGWFGFELYKQMARNENIILLTGDLGFGLFNNHREDLQGQYYNVGASEQCMLDMAVGFALSGKIPVCYSISTFLLYRPFETIRTYINYEKLKVILVGSGRDKDYKDDGISHWSEDAKTILDTQPNIQQYWPLKKEAMGLILKDVLQREGPSFISLRR